MPTITAEPLTKAAFAPFGQVIEADGAESWPINAGKATRYNDLAKVEFTGQNARPLISIFRGPPQSLPYTLQLLERHPLGSQAFVPMTEHPFLVTVALEENGKPGPLRSFLTKRGQGVNISMNTWHGVLTPLGGASEFLIVDRGGDGDNNELFNLDEAWTVLAP